MTNSNENDSAVFLNDTKNLPKSKSNFYHRWWSQHYEHQRFVSEILEKNFFTRITITLLIFDCVFVICQTIVDFTKVKSECIQRNTWIIDRYQHVIEILMKTLHYSSLSILTLFVVEFIIKIYVFGREFWNIHKRKMEYFDGFIVIISFVIDIYFLINENNYFMEYRSAMMTMIRMWRMIRIINSVAQCAISEERKKKDRFNLQYILTIEQLIDLLKYKTNYIEKKFEKTGTCLSEIDQHCQSYLDSYKESSEQIASSDAMAQFSEQLEQLQRSISNEFCLN